MKAAFLTSPNRLELRETAPPEPGEGEVLIKPLQAGICGSDVSFYLGHRTGAYPMVLGHEVAGRIAALGKNVSKFKAGERVVVEPNYPCGECSFCRQGRGCICPNKRSMGIDTPGCFAEYVVAPADFVWPLADSISEADAATIEPLAVSLHALEIAGLHEQDAIAVVGCGAIGLLLVQAAVSRRIRVLAHDIYEEKLEKAARLGAETSPDADPAQLWRAARVAAIFECAGTPQAVARALDAAPRGSKVILLGLSSAPASFSPLRLVREGISIIPSLIYDHPADFENALKLVAGGVLTPSAIVDHTYEFRSIAGAFEQAVTGRTGKIHVVFP